MCDMSAQEGEGVWTTHDTKRKKKHFTMEWGEAGEEVAYFPKAPSFPPATHVVKCHPMMTPPHT